MSKVFDYLKASAGEASLFTKLGFWRQAVTLLSEASASGLAALTAVVDVLATSVAALIVGEPYITQSVWYVNAATGDDKNDGATALTALKTMSELTRRFEGRTISPTVTTVTINLEGTLADPLALRCSGSPSTLIQVLGSTPTQNATGSLTAAFVPFSPATNVAARVTDSTQIWAPLIGKRIRMTSGANVGAITWLAKDLGSNEVRVGQFTERSTGKMKSPTNGDTYVVETLLTSVTGLDVFLGGGVSFYAKDINFAITTDSARAFARALPSTSWVPNRCIFDGCLFSSTNQVKWNQTAAALISCYVASDCRFYHSEITVFGLVFTSFVAPHCGTRFEVCGTSLGQGANASVRVFDNASWMLAFDGAFSAASVGIYDSSFACGIETFGIFNAGTIAGAYLFGSGNSGVNTVTVRAGSQFVYLSKPVITGSGNDSKIGGTVKAWAAVPYVEPANNAMIVPYV